MEEPTLCPSTLLAKLLNLSNRRIRQLGEMGVMHRVKYGQYDLFESLQGYIQFLKKQKTQPRSTDEPFLYDKILKRLEAIELLLTELKKD